MKLWVPQLQTVLIAWSLSTAAAGQAPLGPDQEIGWTHAPFEVGDCSLCHESSDPESPGGVTTPTNDLCFGCHSDIQEMMGELTSTHAAAEDSCTLCHNPHNSRWRGLLVDQAPGLCLDCHVDIAEATDSRVKHDAVTSGDACMNCHDPHAAPVEKLLPQLPYELCQTCHGTDDLRDDQGRVLTNIKKLIENNPYLHGPVEAKDCSACHLTHGGDNFRLLVEEYPAKFYSPYDPELYALCFTCHDSEMVAEPTTDTLTGFRDGDRNLHYLHVNKEKRGRTCRACHEVHAAEQVHIIRDGVPYGTGGWILPINFEPQPNGGTCMKTCHDTKTYDREKSETDGGR